MECACISMNVDGGGGLVLKEIFPTAREPHKCYECGVLISPGDEYLYEKLLDDGHIYTYKTCMSCLSLRKTFFCDGWYYGQTWDDFEGFVSSCYGDISMSNVGKLHPVARARVCEILEQYWEGME
jgi:hypothetical protein